MIITFKTAVLAKEKGYDNNCAAFYKKDGELYNDIEYPSLQAHYELYCYAPIQCNLNNFIRTKKGIHLTVERNASGWYWAMCQTDGGTNLGYSEYSGPNYGGVWDSFEDAFENGLQVALALKLRQYGHWSNFAANAILAYKQTSDLYERDYSNRECNSCSLWTGKECEVQKITLCCSNTKNIKEHKDYWASRHEHEEDAEIYKFKINN